MNLRLICASTYIFQFSIVFKHKAGRDHVIPDALSRLPAKLDPPVKPAQTTATVAQAFSGTTVELLDAFKTKLLKAYSEQEWKPI